MKLPILPEFPTDLSLPGVIWISDLRVLRQSSRKMGLQKQAHDPQILIYSLNHVTWFVPALELLETLVSGRERGTAIPAGRCAASTSPQFKLLILYLPRRALVKPPISDTFQRLADLCKFLTERTPLYHSLRLFGRSVQSSGFVVLMRFDFNSQI